MPCLMFSSLDANDPQLEKITHVLANKICPVILDTIIKGTVSYYRVTPLFLLFVFIARSFMHLSKP